MIFLEGPLLLLLTPGRFICVGAVADCSGEAPPRSWKSFEWGYLGFYGRKVDQVCSLSEVENPDLADQVGEAFNRNKNESKTRIEWR